MQQNVEKAQINQGNSVYLYLNQLLLHISTPSQPFYLITFGNLYSHEMETSSFNTNTTQFLSSAYYGTNEQPLLAGPTINDVPSNLETQNRKEHIYNTSNIQKSARGSSNNRSQLLEYKSIAYYTYRNGNHRFINKNAESNIVNQVFSFLWSPGKSKKYLTKIMGDNTKVNKFYQLMLIIKTNYKSQLNRYYLKQLMSQQQWQNMFNKFNNKTRRLLEIDSGQAAFSVRKLSFKYFRQINRCSIMTSKKMNPQLWLLHFAKCTQIKQFLFQVSPR